MTQPHYPFGSASDRDRSYPQNDQPHDQQPYDPSYGYADENGVQYPYTASPYAGGPYAGGPYAASPYAGAQYPPGTWTPPGAAYPPYAYAPPPAAAPRASRRRAASLAAVAAAAVAAIIGVAAATGASTAVSGTGVTAQQAPVNPNSGTGNFPFGNNGGGNANGSNPNGTNPNGSSPNGNSGNSGSSTGQATAAQQVGVVDIYTKLKYQDAAAAGTGLVIDSSGYVLTNNHVIDGSTSVKVIVISTGKAYTATVVGDAPTQDIAVLKLANASGLQTANFGDSDNVKVGDAVTGVGNAGGTGGTPSAAAGTVQSLNQTITASDESGSNSEKLNGVIVTDAPIQAGDSGGPLYNSSNQVVGIDTAASTNGRPAGFAIPINKALAIAKQIRNGVETSVIHIGYPAFLGVGVQDSASPAGALIANVQPGLPAAKAGIVAGDVITSLNGTSVSSADSLKAAMAKVKPGQTVSVTYVDADGATHHTQATVTTGPAD